MNPQEWDWSRRVVDHLDIHLTVSALPAALASAGCGVGASHRAAASDPPLLVPWNRIGDIPLGESKARVVHEYGTETRRGTTVFTASDLP